MIARLAMAAMAPVALLSATGCGESGSGSADPVTAAPPDSLVFIEGAVGQTAELKEDTELGELLLSRFEERTAGGAAPIDFETEVAPWVGEEAGAFFRHFDGEHFSGGGVILQSTDDAAAQRFIDNPADKAAAYRGVRFRVGKDFTIGLVGDLAVIAEDPASFRAAVDASEDESLGGEERYQDAVADAADGSLADVYLDLGALTGQFQSLFGSQALGLLALAAFEPGTTMVASVFPHQRTVEVEISSNLGAIAPAGGASEALEALPGDAIAAAGIPGFGERLETAIDGLARKGIPGELGPGELGSALRAAGVDLERVASGLGDAGIFVEGDRKLAGGLVVDADHPEQARSAVAELGLFLRRSGTPGVTALGGGTAGFSVSDEKQFGPRPVVVVARGTRIAVGYGAAPALKVFDPRIAPLSEDPDYREAVDALGDTEISAYLEGPGVVRAADDLAQRDPEGDLNEVEPYLEMVNSVAIGSSTMIISFE